MQSSAKHRAARKIIALLSAGLLLAGRAEAASTNSGATFLRLDSSARPAALAGAYTSAAGDLDSLNYNPGGLAAMSRPQATLTHADWLLDTHYDSAAYGQPFEHGTLAASFSRLSYGTLEGRDSQGIPTGNFDASDSVASLAYSANLGSIAGVGATGKFLHSQIGADSASTYAFDVGAVSSLSSHLWLGASVLNIGPGLLFLDQRNPLPLTFALGAAARPARHLTFSLDLKQEPHDRLTEFAGGLEYTPLPVLALRIGYLRLLNGYIDDNSLSVNNMRAGFGLWISRVRLDYTLAPFGDLGLTQRVTLSIFFGTPKKRTLPLNMQPADHFTTPPSHWEKSENVSMGNEDPALDLLNLLDQDSAASIASR